MTEEPTSGSIEKLNAALKTDEEGSGELENAPEWAQALLEDVEANSRRIEDLLEQRQAKREAALEAIGEQIKAQFRANREQIKALDRQTRAGVLGGANNSTGFGSHD